LIAIEGPLEQRASEYLCGFTDGYDALAERFVAALADPEVGAVVLQIDSPGGDLNGLEEGIRRMSEAKAAAGKPVLAYVDELAASAAYWLAASLADEIVLPVAGSVGSIGVIAWYVDETAALEAEGIKLHVHREPAGKAAMHPGAPVVAEADAELQQLVSASAERFARAVADARKLPVHSILALNGGVAYGEEAVRAGLADRVGTLEDTISAALNAAQARTESMTREAQEQEAAARLAQKLPQTNQDTSNAELMTAAAEHIAQQWPLVELGQGVLELAGGTPVEALAAAAAWKESHDRAEQEREQLAAERAAMEAVERLDLLTKLVAAGYETPATAWADPVGAPGKEPHPDHAALPIEALRRRVATMCAKPRTDTGPAPKPAVGVTLTKAQIAKCKEKGWDPDDFARQVQASMERQKAEKQEQIA
jgi:ClpP class serine protease